MTRITARDALLSSVGWQDAFIAPLAGDASNRRYDRLAKPDGTTAVLMDAPPDRGEDTAPFVHIAQHLSKLGLSPPKILANDKEAGFLLIEDLGDALYASLLKTDPSLEDTYYRSAVDVLVHLHRASLPNGVTAYDPATMATLAGLAFTWYRTAACPDDPFDPDPLLAELERQLEAIWPENPVLVLRDYHAENLLWLPDRTGAARVGLLDFQDAQSGHPAYDLVSLVTDARRDVSPSTQSAMITYYADQTETDLTSLTEAAALCGLQRNLRILGVFARLHLRDGKSHYLDLLPRVWGHLEKEFAAVTEADLGPRFQEALPPPDSTVQNRIKSR